MNDARIEVRVPTQQRLELVQLARDTGLTVPGLVRLATQRLLDDRASLLHITISTKELRQHDPRAKRSRVGRSHPQTFRGG